jgi:hypothetical protein
MNILYFKEEHPYSEIFLSEKIDSVGYLLDEGILSITNSPNKEEERFYKFSYVGFIFDNLHDHVRILAVLPKYLDFEKMSPHAKKNSSILLVKVFSKYAKDSVQHDKWDELNLLSENSQFNIFSISEYLVRDFLEYGLYRKEAKTWEINGHGEIDWTRTVTVENALVSNEQAIYPYLHTHSRETDENNKVRAIHHSCINKAVTALSALDIFEVFDFSIPFIPEAKHSIFSKDQQASIIARELSNTFSDRNIHLLKALLYFISNTSTTSKKDIALYGTKKFHTVWEAAVSSIFNDEYVYYKHIIPKPKWIHCDTGEETARETLQPDTLRMIGKNFYIVDSKYYKIPFDNNGKVVNSIPGISDIGKQYLYAKAFNQVKRNKSIHNCFLFPADKDSIKHFGIVEFALFPELDDIHLIAFPAKKLFEYYINSKTLSDTEIEKILQKPIKKKKDT